MSHLPAEVLRGKRSGVAIAATKDDRTADSGRNEDGLEPEDDYFERMLGKQQSSPSANDNNSEQSATPISKTTSMLRQKRIRFSLPMARTKSEHTEQTHSDDDEGTAKSGQSNWSNVGKKLTKLPQNQAISPSELSQVSTAPPSANRAEEVDAEVDAKLFPLDSSDQPTIENDRSMLDTADVNEDLLPPPPPSDEEEEEGAFGDIKSHKLASQSQDNSLPLTTQPDLSSSPSDDVNDQDVDNFTGGDFDDDDGDNEGDGYTLRVATPPASAKARRKSTATPRVATPVHDADTPLAYSRAEARDSGNVPTPRLLESSIIRKKKSVASAKDSPPTDTEDEDPVTPVVKRGRGRPKNKDRRISVETKSSPKESSPEVERQSKKRKKNGRATVFSPKGIQSGPRQYQAVPVSDLKNEISPSDENKRRSRRVHIRPLEFWKNERYVYGPNEFDPQDGYVGVADMPVPHAVSKAQPTPYKKRKYYRTSSSGGGGLGRSTKSTKQVVAPSPEKEPFDSSKLKRKYEYFEGDQARIWDDSTEDATEMKIVSFKGDMEERELPLAKSRTRADGKVVGRAAQAFNVANDSNPSYAGYIVGNLTLPPKGIKDAESVGACAQIFTVVSCQPNSFEVSFADPDEEGEGLLNPSTAQRFLLGGPGDMFRIPPGNCYRLQNHSRNVDTFLTWTIIRPFANTES